MDDEHEGEWDPEDDKLQRELLREQLKYFRYVNASLDEMRKAQAMPVRGAQPPKAMSLEMPGAPSVVGTEGVSPRLYLAPRPNRNEIAQMVKSAWEDTMRILGQGAPPEIVREMYFRLLFAAENDWHERAMQQRADGHREEKSLDTPGADQ